MLQRSRAHIRQFTMPPTVGIDAALARESRGSNDNRQMEVIGNLGIDVDLNRDNSFRKDASGHLNNGRQFCANAKLFRQ